MDQASPEGALAREIALATQQLEGCHNTFERVLRDLATETEKIGSEVLQTERVFGRASDIRNQLQGRLLTLKAEKRQIELQRQRELRELSARLLELLNKYAYLADVPNR